ncbi:hypothetical protein [Absidia glauca]|uniref:Uncharacterized protein n=1 Tax=Absidia glauca TaxID=4829 RepID=A0A163IZX2_ABSGL|nr:hypothetical protein [Absidia glauca]
MEKTLILTAYAYWEIAFIYAFTVYFDRPDLATLFPTPVISPQILEDAVVNDAHGLLGDLMRAFLSNAMNRKKPLLPENSDRLLFSYIGSKLQVDDFDLGYNPLANHGSFEGLTPELKVSEARMNSQPKPNTISLSIA